MLLEAICTNVEGEKKRLLRVRSQQGGDMNTIGLVRGVIAAHWGVSLRCVHSPQAFCSIREMEGES